MEILFSHAREIIRNSEQAGLRRVSYDFSYTALSRTEMERSGIEVAWRGCRKGKSKLACGEFLIISRIGRLAALRWSEAESKWHGKGAVKVARHSNINYDNEVNIV